MQSIEARALNRYFRAAKTKGVVPDQPMSDGVEVDRARSRVLVRNNYRVLAVYEFVDHGKRVTFTDAEREPVDEVW